MLIAEPAAHIGFAGPSVIEQTIREKLPDGFQTADFLFEHGMLDLVEPRENLRRTIRGLLELHASARDARDVPDGARRTVCRRRTAQSPTNDPDAVPERRPWDVVQLARHLERPHTLEYVGAVFDGFQELHGDRLFSDDAAIVGGLATLGELPVVVIGHQKGSTTAEMMERNFGMPAAGRLPQGHAADALCGQVRHADRDPCGHARRLSRRRRRGARAVGGDRGVDHADVAAAACRSSRS